MEDNSGWWSSLTSEEEWKQRLTEAEERWDREYREKSAEDKARSARRAAVWKEFGNDGASRRKAIWRERKEEGATLQAIGDRYGITKERVRQIVAKRDREIKKEANHGG